MRRSCFKYPVLWVSFWCVGSLAFAQAPAVLPELLRAAATQHPIVKNRESEQLAAGFELEAARWSRYPSLGSQLQSVNGGAQAVLQLRQPVWTGGRITGQINLAQATLDSAAAAVGSAELQIMQQTASAFFEVLRLEARLRAARDNETEHQRLLEIIQRRVSAEVSPMTDQTQAAARFQQAVSERMQTERQLRSIRLQLEQLVGRPVPHVAPPRRVAMPMWDEASLQQSALDHAPERKRLLAQVAAADAAMVTARSQLMPQVVLNYEHRLGTVRLGEDRDRLYVGLELQTGSGLSGLSANQVAVARRQAAKDSIEVHDRQLTQSVSASWAEVQALTRQLAPARALLGGTDEVVASYLRQFQVGRKNWLDVLNAQREKTNAYYALADIEFPLQLAQVQLLMLAGAVHAKNTNAIHE